MRHDLIYEQQDVKYVKLDAEIHARIPAQDVAQELVSDNCVLY